MLQHQPVGQTGQRVVLGVVVETVRGLAGLLASLRVEQVRGGDVGQRLRHIHVARVHLAGGFPVEVQRPQPAVAMAQREGEHRGQPGGHRRRGELREPVIGTQVSD